MANKSIQVRIDLDIYEVLSDLAKKDGRSVANYTNQRLRGLIRVAKGLNKPPKGKLG
jgi:hypothetical protein